MSSYLCFIYVRPNSVPELRALPCDRDDDLEPCLVQVLREWVRPHRVEVMEGARVVIRASGEDLSSLRGSETRSYP